MNLTFKITVILVAATILLPSASALGVVIAVPNALGGSQNLRVGSLGATTAVTVSVGNHVVGPAGTASRWARPIVQFPATSFASISGMTVDSATLHFVIISDFLEPGETGSSDLRLFSTAETSLDFANRDVYAGLSGDGGAHTSIGTAFWSEGVTGAQSVAFSPAGRLALQNAISSGDPTIVIAFREFSVVGFGADLLDEVVLGVPAGNMRLEITATPEPTTVALLALGSPAALRRRRRA